MIDPDIMLVGAGPSGLLLACELAAAKIRVLEWDCAGIFFDLRGCSAPGFFTAPPMAAACFLIDPDEMPARCGKQR
jgi:hypothetical protein